jgi:hypothetical protein
MNKLKHWQLFGIALIPFLMSLYVDNQYYNGLTKSLSVVFVMFYYLTIGEFLKDAMTEKIRGHNFFRFNCAYMVTMTTIINVGGTEIFNDYLPIVIIVLVYFLIAFLQTVDHLALLLRTAERKETDNYKQRNEFLLFIIWPVGVWTLQPRINKIE